MFPSYKFLIILSIVGFSILGSIYLLYGCAPYYPTCYDYIPIVNPVDFTMQSQNQNVWTNIVVFHQCMYQDPQTFSSLEEAQAYAKENYPKSKMIELFKLKENPSICILPLKKQENYVLTGIFFLCLAGLLLIFLGLYYLWKKYCKKEILPN